VKEKGGKEERYRENVSYKGKTNAKRFEIRTKKDLGGYHFRPLKWPLYHWVKNKKTQRYRIM
jgi:hypothetical protein